MVVLKAVVSQEEFLQPVGCSFGGFVMLLKGCTINELVCNGEGGSVGTTDGPGVAEAAGIIVG